MQLKQIAKIPFVLLHRNKKNSILFFLRVLRIIDAKLNTTIDYTTIDKTKMWNSTANGLSLQSQTHGGVLSVTKQLF